MTAPAESKTAVAVQPKKKLLDVESAKMNQRFLDAYTNGKLDRLSAEEQGLFLFALGAKLGLRPELGELMLYQGKPYITLAGKLRIAHGTGLFIGAVPRPATAMEARNYGAEAGESVWVCDVYRRGSPHPFRGWGHASRTADRNVVAKSSPREMAKKRAKYDGLSLAFPPDETIGPLHRQFIAQAEEEILAQGRERKQIAMGGYDELPAPVAAAPSVETVDPETGEVLPDESPADVTVAEDDPLAEDQALVAAEAAREEYPMQGAVPLPRPMRQRRA